MEAGQQFIAECCHWDDALKRHLVCSRWYFAEVRKEIVPNYHGGYWELADDVERRVSWEAKYRGEERGITEDHAGEKYARWDCPWCLGEAKPIPAPRIAPRDDAA